MPLLRAGRAVHIRPAGCSAARGCCLIWESLSSPLGASTALQCSVCVLAGQAVEALLALAWLPGRPRLA